MTNVADKQAAMPDNAALVLEVFDRLSVGDFEAAKELLAADGRFFSSGDMPYCGWYDRDTFLSQAMALKPQGTLTIKIGHVLSDGDWVAMEMESDCVLTNGNRYNNTYVFLLEFRDGKIVTWKEHTDTLHTLRALNDEPSVTGPTKPRESPLTYVSKTITAG